MFDEFKKERQTAEDKVAQIKQVLVASETNLGKICEKISDSPALQKQ